MKPRRDQIEAVMQRDGCTYDEAVERCQAAFKAWRDEPRKWISLTTWRGGYFVAEDK